MIWKWLVFGLDFVGICNIFEVVWMRARSLKSGRNLYFRLFVLFLCVFLLSYLCFFFILAVNDCLAHDLYDVYHVLCFVFTSYFCTRLYSEICTRKECKIQNVVCCCEIWVGWVGFSFLSFWHVLESNYSNKFKKNFFFLSLWLFTYFVLWSCGPGSFTIYFTC